MAPQRSAEFHKPIVRILFLSGLLSVPLCNLFSGLPSLVGALVLFASVGGGGGPLLGEPEILLWSGDGVPRFACVTARPNAFPTVWAVLRWASFCPVGVSSSVLGGILAFEQGRDRSFFTAAFWEPFPSDFASVWVLLACFVFFFTFLVLVLELGDAFPFAFALLAFAFLFGFASLSGLDTGEGVKANCCLVHPASTLS